MPAGSDTRQYNLCGVLDPSEKISAGLDTRWNTFFFSAMFDTTPNFP
jgi:hypothetical protein